jgi:cytochrome P450
MLNCAQRTFEKNTLSLLVNVLPSITARTASHARTAVGKAFNDYFKKDQHRKGSSLVQARYDHSRRYKVAVEDIARFEVGGAIAILVNTYPAAFWMINYVFSNPTVLEECRAELQNVTRTTTESDGTAVHCIDMDSVKKSCPILASTFQEVLRHRSVGLSVREVMEDTLLDGKYLLKKGGITMISADLLHSDVAVWGEDLASFDHHRFLKGTSKKVPNPVAFRAFGGGSTLCPGRHFATVEVMALASILISRFDIVPVGGVWSNTEVRDVKLWAQIVDADATLEVELSERKIYEGHHVWKLGLTNPKLLFAMAAEDID